MRPSSIVLLSIFQISLISSSFAQPPGTVGAQAIYLPYGTTSSTPALSITNGQQGYSIVAYDITPNFPGPGTTTTRTLWLNKGGEFGVNSLATGGANKMVTSNSSGVLGIEAMPTLSLAGNTLSISGGNSVTLPAGTGDNLGNHMASTNLNMNNKSILAVQTLRFQNANQWIQGNATNNSISFSGAVGIGGAVPFAIGTSLEVTGNVVVSGTITSSDRRYKKNFKTIDNLSERLFSLTPYQYNYKKDEFKSKNFDDNLHFGLVAQEVKEVFPNIVTVIDSEGHMGINYVELIPILIQSAKEQRAKIKELEDKIAKLEAKENNHADDNEDDLKSDSPNQYENSSLDQNSPNPFNKETTISYNITGKFKNAFIGIYDLNGSQIKQISIYESRAQVDIPANMLRPGTYIYSLIVEGQLIKSKKMVVIN